MTIFGLDLSSFQAGLNLAEVKAEGFDFVWIKVSQGSDYVNPTWPGFRDAAVANGLILAGYHYLDTSPVAAQAELFVSNLGPHPAMIDFEDGGGDIANLWAFIHAVNALGKRISLTYAPEWFIRQIGSPELSTIPGIISSNYPGGSGYASNLYAAGGGDSGPGWDAYCGAQPVVWQFTDQASVAGQQVDANAFRGTLAELDALLNGADMELTDTLTNAAGQTVTVAQILTAIDFHASMSLEQQAGPGTSEQPGPSLTATGWEQLGGRSIVDALAIIGEKLGVPGFRAPGSAA